MTRRADLLSSMSNANVLDSPSKNDSAGRKPSARRRIVRVSCARAGRPFSQGSGPARPGGCVPLSEVMKLSPNLFFPPSGGVGE